MDDEGDDHIADPIALEAGRKAVEDALRQHIVVDRFPLPSAGAPLVTAPHISDLETQYDQDITDANNPYSPFASRLDWEVARWAKLRGPGSTAVSELFAIDGVSLAALLRLPFSFYSDPG